MKCRYIDIDNMLYYELYDFYCIVRNRYLDSGYSSKDARAYAYDAIELRFNIKKDRARAIMYDVRNNPKNISAMRGMFYANNKELIDLLNIINDEYSK